MVQVEAIQTMGLALRVMFNINHSVSDIIGHLAPNHISSMTISLCFKEQKIRGFLRRTCYGTSCSHPYNGTDFKGQV